MTKLSINQASLAGKSSKLALAQEYAAGGNRENLNDPDGGFIVTNTQTGQVIRFNTLAQLQDFIASTGPGGKWPN